MREWGKGSPKYSEEAIVAALNESDSIEQACKAIGIRGLRYRAARSENIRTAVKACRARTDGPTGHKRKYSSTDICSALDTAKYPQEAAQALGAEHNVFFYRSKTDPAIAAAFAACQARAKGKRTYNRERVESALREGNGRKGTAAALLGVTTAQLNKWLSRAPKGFEALALTCIAKSARPYRGKWPAEKIIAALDAALTVTEAGRAMGMSDNLIHRLRKRHAGIEIAASACATRGRLNAKKCLQMAAHPPLTGQKAEFNFHDHVGKFAHLAKPLARANVTYLTGVRVKTIKRYHKSFSIVLVDDVGNELEANNAWGRYFVAGVTRRYLNFEEP